MELQAFARQVLFSDDLETKLLRPDTEFTDNEPGEAERVPLPGRPTSLAITDDPHGPPMPHVNTFSESRRRGIAHHIMANHELQALEVMASVLLEYPNSPAPFRYGMARVMFDEQRHTRLHMQRCEALNVPFGSLPVNAHIWLKSREFTCELDYLAGLPLTFEGRNLDHTLELQEVFLRVGDERSADIMRAIHLDEIDHVRFGVEWLRYFKPPHQSDWETFCKHLKWPMRPERSLGKRFDEASRRAAGLDDDFLSHLKAIAIRTGD